MISILSASRKIALRIFALTSVLWLAACDELGLSMTQNTGPLVDSSAPVPVALLVPAGSGSPTDALLAKHFENSARMAIADLQNARIDLRVYSTGATANGAANAAVRAVNEGAAVILGPLFAESANAAGLAILQSNVNVLSFSNNSAIAGGNVFILGYTFENTANRLVRFAVSRGQSRITVVHADDIAGQAGRDAILRAIANSSATLAGVAAYPLSQQGVAVGAGQVVATVKANGGQAIFMTAGVNAELPILTTLLLESGLSTAQAQYIGLTRWDSLPQSLTLPALQGGIFAIPDSSRMSVFESRYASAYGEQPHQLAGLAYDGIAAIGALVASGHRDPLSRAALVQRNGFQGTGGIFRFNENGTNSRALAVATIQNNQVVIVDPAPSSFSGVGF